MSAYIDQMEDFCQELDVKWYKSNAVLPFNQIA
jgi:hypothetical protein